MQVTVYCCFLTLYIIIICNQANVHCYVDYQGRNIFIMHHVLKFFNSSFTNFQQFQNRNWALKNIHWFLPCISLTVTIIIITLYISPSLGFPDLEWESDFWAGNWHIQWYKCSFLGIICHDNHATPIAIHMLMAINNGAKAIALDKNSHSHVLWNHHTIVVCMWYLDHSIDVIN